MFSFQAIKLVSCGDGGALICSNETDYKRAKLLRWYGIDREAPYQDVHCEDDIKEFGFKFHMNDISAVIGIANLKDYKIRLARARENAEFYNNELSYFKNKGLNPLSFNDPYFEGAYWLYTIRVENSFALRLFLKQKGIASSKVHTRNDKYTMMAGFAEENDLPGVDEFAKYHLCIPVGWWVSSQQREYIVKCIKEIYDLVD